MSRPKDFYTLDDFKTSSIDDNSKKDIDTPADSELYNLYGGWIDPTWESWIKKRQTDNEEYIKNQRDLTNSTQNSTATCDCGSWKTYGNNYDKNLHSSWCSLSFRLK